MFNIKNTLWQLVNLGTIQVCPIAPHKVILFNPSISFCSFKSPNLEGCSSTLSTPPWSTQDIMHPLRIFGLLLACWTLQSQSPPYHPGGLVKHAPNLPFLSAIDIPTQLKLSMLRQKDLLYERTNNVLPFTTKN